MTGRPPDPLPWRVAATLSWAGLGLGVFLLALLAGIQLTVDSTRPGAEILTGPFDNLVIGSLLVLVLVSVMVQIWVQIVRGQRRLMAQVHTVRLQVLALAEWRVPTTGRATVVNGRRDDTAPELQEQLAGVNGNGKVEVEGLSAEMVEIARRTSARLRQQ